MIKEFAKFNYNGKKYVITISEENKIEFFFLDNGQYNSNINNEEKTLFFHILDKICIRPESSIFLRKRNVNGRNYSIYYDRRTLLHWWKHEKGINYEEDNVFLNFFYNHNELVKYEQKQKDNNNIFNKYFNRTIKWKNEIVLVLILAILNLPGVVILADNIDRIQIEQEIQQSIEEFFKEIEQGREYNYEDIEKAIEGNKKLTKKEKDFFKKLKFVFDEDHEYMNLDLIISRLSKLYMIYALFENGNIAASYNPILNYITFYNTINFNTADKDFAVHESGHVFVDDPNMTYHEELAVEIWSREITRRLIESGAIETKPKNYDSNGALTIFGEGYEDDVKLYYCFLKLLPTAEERKKFLYRIDFDIIKNRLLEVDPDQNAKSAEARVINLIDDINALKKDKSRELKKKIFESIDYYYSNRYGIHIYEDLNFLMAFCDEWYNGYTEGTLADIYYDELHIGFLQESLSIALFGKDLEYQAAELLGQGNTIPENIFFPDSRPALFYYKDMNDGTIKIIDLTLDKREKYYNMYTIKLEEQDEDLEEIGRQEVIDAKCDKAIEEYYAKQANRKG